MENNLNSLSICPVCKVNRGNGHLDAKRCSAKLKQLHDQAVDRGLSGEGLDSYIRRMLIK